MAFKGVGASDDVVEGFFLPDLVGGWGWHFCFFEGSFLGRRTLLVFLGMVLRPESGGTPLLL